MIFMKDRKFMRSKDGKSYALYKNIDEQTSCTWDHVQNWIAKDLDMPGRDFMQTYPLFPCTDEKLRKVSVHSFLFKAFS